MLGILGISYTSASSWAAEERHWDMYYAGTGANAHQAAPVEVTEDVAEQRILRLAQEGSTLHQALVAAHAFRRLHSSEPFEYAKVC